MVNFGAFAQRVQHHARLDTRESCLGVDLQDPIHVFREIEHHRDVAALPGQARARAARQNRGAKFLHAVIVAMTSSSSRGTTRPIGICR